MHKGCIGAGTGGQFATRSVCTSRGNRRFGIQNHDGFEFGDPFEFGFVGSVVWVGWESPQGFGFGVFGTGRLSFS